MNFAVTDLSANLLEHRFNVRIQVPLVHSRERGIGQCVEALGDAQVVPPADVLLVRVIGPRVVRDANYSLLDVYEACLLEQLASSVLVCNRARNSIRSVCNPSVPLREHAVRGKCIVVATGLHVNLNVLDPAGARFQVSA